MPFAARVKDPTGHPGAVGPPGVPIVLIEGMPAAVATGLHICSMPPPTGPHSPSPFPKGSITVLIGGRPALRVGDVSGCGAPILVGAVTVDIGG